MPMIHLHRRKKEAKDGAHNSTVPRDPSGYINVAGTNAEGLTSSQFEELRSLFIEFDRDHSGALEPEEMKAALVLLGIEGEDSALETLIAGIDLDQNGRVEWDEFLSFGAEKLSHPSSKHATNEMDYALKYVAAKCRHPLQTPGIDEDDELVDSSSLVRMLREVGDTPFHTSEQGSLLKLIEQFEVDHPADGARCIRTGDFRRLICWEGVSQPPPRTSPSQPEEGAGVGPPIGSRQPQPPLATTTTTTTTAVVDQAEPLETVAVVEAVPADEALTVEAVPADEEAGEATEQQPEGE